MKKINNTLTVVSFGLFIFLLFFLKPPQILGQQSIRLSVNPNVILNQDFGQLLGGYINTRANLNPESKFVLAQDFIVNEAKKMFPHPPEFPNPVVMRTQSFKMLENDNYALTDAEVEDIIKFCSQADCDPMFGAFNAGGWRDNYWGTFDISRGGITNRARFVKEKCRQYFNDEQHCLHWDIGNEPPSPASNCEFYGRTLIPDAVSAIKSVIPNAVIHAPELYLDSAKARDGGVSRTETIGECIVREAQNTNPNIKIDVVTTHWYPYNCGSSPQTASNIDGSKLLSWTGQNGPVYEKMTYPFDIVANMKSWMSKYQTSREAVIGIGELNPMSNCSGGEITSRVNGTWGSAFWHLDVLGIMAEAGIKYSQKHIHISGSGGNYEAMVVSGNNVLLTPPYFAYRFYSQHFGHEIVQSRSDNPSELNIHASLDKDKNLRIILINKSTSGASQKALVNLSNFTADGNAEAYKFSGGGNFNDRPTLDRNNPFTVQTGIQAGNNFEYTVPAYSAVILKIPGRPQTDSCLSGGLGNINCDPMGKIDETDLNILLSSWTLSGPVPTPFSTHHSADLNSDGRINQTDLDILLSNWHP